MSTSPVMTPLFTLLLGQSPLLLIYLGAIILCAILWRRAPLGALLAILGIGLMVLATLTTVGSSAWMMQRRTSGGGGGGGSSAVSLGAVMSIVAVVATLMRAGGLALLVGGVFAGRDREPRGFDVPMTSR